MGACCCHREKDDTQKNMVELNNSRPTSPAKAGEHFIIPDDDNDLYDIKEETYN